jgi:hypothetical protein
LLGIFDKKINNMKATLKTLVLSLVIAITFSGCKKSDDANTATGASGSVTAANFGFDGGTTSAFKSTAAGMVKVGNLLTISAIQDGTPVSITIILGNVTATGTYSLDKGNTQGNGAIISKDHTKPSDTALNYSTDNTNATGTIGGGQVIITKLTATEAEGTFYIVAFNSAKKDAFAEQGKFSGKLN